MRDMLDCIKSCRAYGIDKLITRTHLLLLLFSLLALTTATAYAQVPSFTNPAPSSTISGVVLIQGTATDPAFLRYEIAFLREDNPGAGWIVFGEGSQQVIDGTLAVWDTTVGQSVNAPVFPDGRYQLRMRVVRQDSNYDEYFVGGLVIANNTTPIEPPTTVPTIALPTETPVQPNPTAQLPTPIQEAGNPTAVPTTAPINPTTSPADSASPTPNWQATADAQTATPTPIPTATPLITRIAPTAITVATLDLTSVAVPDSLPTLTPFPTPPPLPTVEGQGFVLANADGEPAEPAEIVENVVSFDYSQFGTAFGQGFRLVFLLFGILGLYLLLRNGIRWLWRLISSNW